MIFVLTPGGLLPPVSFFVSFWHTVSAINLSVSSQLYLTTTTTVFDSDLRLEFIHDMFQMKLVSLGRDLEFSVLLLHSDVLVCE